MTEQEIFQLIAEQRREVSHAFWTRFAAYLVGNSILLVSLTSIFAIENGFYALEWAFPILGISWAIAMGISGWIGHDTQRNWVEFASGKLDQGYLDVLIAMRSPHFFQWSPALVMSIVGLVGFFAVWVWVLVGLFLRLCNA